MIRIGGMLLLLLLLAVSGGSSPALAGEGDRILDFAAHLYEEGDYQRAVTEAKRFIFLDPGSPRFIEARLLLARACLEGGLWSEARAAFLQVSTQTDRPDLAAAARLELGRGLERSDTDRAVDYYGRLMRDPGPPAGQASRIKATAAYRLGWLHLRAGRWAAAREAWESVPPGYPQSGAAGMLAARADRGRNPPTVSPGVAGVLSLGLPGAGQVYTGRYMEAALAFGFNLVFILGLVQAYKARTWVVFLILALMELAWFGGNFYNAVNGAFLENTRTRQVFVQRLEREYAWLE